MSSTKLFLWSKAPVIWSYGIALLSVIAVAIISLWPSFHLQTAPASLFLCAILFGAWLGGAGPGLLATALSATVFYYYFLPPVHSLAVKPEEIPRFVVFLVAALFVWSPSAAQRRATESVRRARDDLKATVQDLQRINEELQTESRERKQAEDALRQAQTDLAHVNRVITMGELTAFLAHEVNQATDLPQVMGDRVQLQQVFMNLMFNGIDAMKDMKAGGELTIRSRQAENGQLLISVSDTGVGLPPQQADQIFNAFFTTKVQGTGMGLPISRSIVESHGGHLWAADNSPRGASFYVSLPTKVEVHE